MIDKPERIWIEADNECSYFYHEDELSEVGSPVTGYVREDIFARKDAELASVKAERDEAVYKWNGADGDMKGAALHAVRETLYAGEVPVAAFIDDHVANAIIQRNQERSRAKRAEAQLAEALKALEQIEQQLDYGQINMALHITRRALAGDSLMKASTLPQPNR